MLGATDKVQGTGNGNDKLLDPPSKFFLRRKILQPNSAEDEIKYDLLLDLEESRLLARSQTLNYGM